MAIASPGAITTLVEAEERFSLSRTEDESFFQEWRTDLPELTATEKAALNDLRRRYLYQRSQRHLREGTVTLLFASLLITIAGFYAPPFKVQAEEPVQLSLNDGEEVLQGRIDVLVLKDGLWVVVLESKKTALSVWAALPQALAYLMANPQPKHPGFALITNGDDSVFVKLSRSVFVKLSRGESPQYGLSRVFAAFTSTEELYSVLQILKRISQGMTETSIAS